VSRFFKSAAFPILIVVVLAFFAQRLINPGEGEKAPNYTEFRSLVSEGKVSQATLNTKDNTIDYTATGEDAKKHKWSTAYPDNTEPQLTDTLARNTARRGGRGGRAGSTGPDSGSSGRSCRAA
jgi:cell division protease FtsH